MQVFISQIDAFDPERAQDTTGYAGELGLCAVNSASLRDAIERTLDAIENDGVRVKAIDFCGPAADYPGDPSVLNVSLAELEQAAVASGVVVFSDVTAYGAE